MGPKPAPLPAREWLRRRVIINNRIWSWCDDERTYWQELPVREKDGFRLFVIGLKLEYWAVNPIDIVDPSHIPNPDTIAAWESATDVEKARLQRASEGLHNPYHIALSPLLVDGDWERIQNLPDIEKHYECYIWWRRAFLGTEPTGPEFERGWMKARDSSDHPATAWVTEQIEQMHNIPWRLRESTSIDHMYVDGPVPPQPTRGDEKFVGQQMSEWISNGDWFFDKAIVEKLKSNDYTRVIHLFASLDNSGILRKRIVVKIQGYRTRQKAVKETMSEYGIHRRLTKPESPYIIDCYGCSLRERKLDDRPPYLGYGFMDYAPYGDLHDVVDSCRSYVPEPFSHNNFIPEPFIWRVFRGIAEALYALEMGDNIPGTEPTSYESKMDNTTYRGIKLKKEWRSVLNTDIKPDNVALGNHDAAYPAYKMPNMIDFGLAKSVASDQPSGNKWRWPRGILRGRSGGTRGFRPPEQLTTRNLEQYTTDYEIDVHSHIFNFGLIILSLMNGRRVVFDNASGKAPGHHPDYQGMYSHPLNELVMKCVVLKPDERASLAHVLYATRKGLRRWERFYGKVAGKKAEDLPPSAKMEFKKEEEKKIGDFMGAA